MLTIKQIAEEAGTSRGTVDRVLNGRGNVNPELAKRIMEIAEREQYRPNPLAQALIQSRQHTRIGMVIPSVGNPFFDEVLRGAEYRAKKLAGYGASVSLRKIRGYDTATQLEAIHSLMEEGIDGLAVTPINVPEVADCLRSLDVPVLTFNMDIDIDRVAFVGCNYYNSGMISGDLAGLMLNGTGHIIAVIGSSNMRGHMERIRGLKAALERYPEIAVDAVLENEDNDEISYRIVRDAIAAYSPDVLYFGSGGTEGGMRAVCESGARVRVLAVDETEAVLRYMEEGRISATVTQEPFVQGDKAIHTLFDYIRTGHKPAGGVVYTQNRVRLPHSL